MSRHRTRVNRAPEATVEATRSRSWPPQRSTGAHRKTIGTGRVSLFKLTPSTCSRINWPISVSSPSLDAHDVEAGRELDRPSVRMTDGRDSQPAGDPASEQRPLPPNLSKDVIGQRSTRKNRSKELRPSDYVVEAEPAVKTSRSRRSTNVKHARINRMLLLTVPF